MKKSAGNGDGAAVSISRRTLTRLTDALCSKQQPDHPVGRGGHGTGTYAEGGGDGGKLAVGTLKIVSSTVKSAGKKESTTSLLQNGFGAGGKAGDLGENGAGGTNGYVKIVYLGQA